MIKIEAVTLEDAYKKAAIKLECSVTNLNIEVVQAPTSGFLGFFRKTAIIVATKGLDSEPSSESKKNVEVIKVKEESPAPSSMKNASMENSVEAPLENIQKKEEVQEVQEVYKDTIMPQSFVSIQDTEQDDELKDAQEDDKDMDEESYEEILQEEAINIDDIVLEVKKDVNALFEKICFDIDEVKVSKYDDSTLLIEFSGVDAALLIGKEGYRYKALSYMLFNWINTKYRVSLRLEIAEFLKNQEESVSRYLESVFENVDREGRAQTKILDGVLVQIALKELRSKYPDKYVAIRTTRDGLKYIIINDYHNS